jgi:hypothetical protein
MFWSSGFGAATHGMFPGRVLSGCGTSEGPCHLQSEALGTNTVTQIAANPFPKTGLRVAIANEACKSMQHRHIHALVTKAPPLLEPQYC